MNGLSRVDVAARAGVGPSDVDRLVALGIIVPDDAGAFSAGDVRRVVIVRTLERSGVPRSGARPCRAARTRRERMRNA
jgi:hypothetical protein